MSRSIQALAVVLFVPLSLSLSGPTLGTEQEVAQTAIETYRSALDSSDRNRRVEQFRRAELLFEKIAKETQSPSEDLLMCIGNSALGAERIGPAIVAFRRVLEIDADHQTARQNLDHARSLLPTWLPRPEDSISLGSIFDRLKRLSSGGWRAASSLLFLIASIAFAFYLRSGVGGFRNVAIGIAVLWSITFAASFFAGGQEEIAIAVVIVPDTTARSADSVNAPARLAEPLPSGTEAGVIEQRGDWLKVRLFDGREAWLSRSAVEIV